MSKRPTTRSTGLQITELINYMDTNRSFANGEYNGHIGHELFLEQWAELKRILAAFGPDKSVEQWRHTWRDLKKRAREESKLAMIACAETGNNSALALSDQHKKILSIIGEDHDIGAIETVIEEAPKTGSINTHQLFIKPTVSKAKDREKATNIKLKKVVVHVPKNEQNPHASCSYNAQRDHGESTSAMFEFADVKSEDQLAIEDENLMACRGCVTTERSLQPLDRSQASLYQQLTGTPVSPSDIYPKFLCSYCRAMLRKFATFRENCLSIQEAFSKIHSSGILITSNLLQSIIDHAPSYPHLKSTPIQLIDLNRQHPEYSSYIVHSCTGVENKTTVDSAISNNLVRSYTDNAEINIPDLMDVDNQSISGDETSHFIDSLVRLNADVHQKDSKKPFEEKLIQSTANKKQRAVANKGGGSNSFHDNDLKTIKIEHDYGIRIDHDNSNEGDDDVMHDASDCMSDDDFNSRTEPAYSNEVTIRVEEKKKIRRLARGKNAIEQKYNITIVHLSDEEQVAKMVTRKESMRYKRGPYRCESCYLGFVNRITYEKHMAKHDPSNGNNICDICYLRFRDLRVWRQHMNSHRCDYVCNECGLVNKTTSKAAIHHNWHKGVKYDCKVCGKLFEKKGDRAVGAVCGTCGVQFHSHDALRRHLPQDGIGSCDHTHRPCAACGEGFPTDQLLNEHKMEIHSQNNQEYTCDMCFKKYDNLKKYNDHVLRHFCNKSRRRKGSARTKNPAICEVCGIVKENERTMKYHMMNHTKTFQCDHCQRLFSLKANLKAHIILMHMSTESELNQYSCDYCYRTFNLRRNKVAHEKRVHLKVKSHKCNFCGNMFYGSSCLKRHINTIHFGMPERKYIRSRNRRKK